MSYIIQEIYNMEGYFVVKATPLGTNICLLEEIEDSKLSELVESRRYRLKQWFKKIHKWDPKDVNKDRVTWLIIYDVPCHALSPDFFKFVTKHVGFYVCLEDDTMELSKMDVARILIRTSCSMVLKRCLMLKSIISSILSKSLI